MEGDSVKYNIHSSMGEASLVDVWCVPGAWRMAKEAASLCSIFRARILASVSAKFCSSRGPHNQPGLDTGGWSWTRTEIEEDLFPFFPPRTQEAMSSGGWRRISRGPRSSVASAAVQLIVMPRGSASAEPFRATVLNLQYLAPYFIPAVTRASAAP